MSLDRTKKAPQIIRGTPGVTTMLLYGGEGWI